jgi:hypothetical protein
MRLLQRITTCQLYVTISLLAAFLSLFLFSLCFFPSSFFFVGVSQAVCYRRGSFALAPVGILPAARRCWSLARSPSGCADRIGLLCCSARRSYVFLRSILYASSWSWWSAVAMLRCCSQRGRGVPRPRYGPGPRWCTGDSALRFVWPVVVGAVAVLLLSCLSCSCRRR